MHFCNPTLSSQEALQKTWGAFSAFVIAIKREAVVAIKNLEEHGLAEGPGSLRSLQKLITLDAKRDAARRLAEKVSAKHDVETTLTACQRRMFIGFHWSRWNARLPQEKWDDDSAKEAWAAGVPSEAVNLNLRSWRPTDDRPVPPQEMLERAKLYTDPKHVAWLDQLERPIVRPLLDPSSTEKVRVWDLPSRQKVRLYKAEDAIPAGLAATPVKLVFAHVEDLMELTPMVKNCVVKGSIVVVWGRQIDVEHSLRNIQKLGVRVKEVHVRLFIRPTAGPTQGSSSTTSRPLECQELDMAVLGHPGRFNETVCPCPL